LEGSRYARSGPISDGRQQSRAIYRKRLRECEQQSTLSYTNDLHDALLKKNGAAFWKCWRANFDGPVKCTEVEKCVDSDIIVEKFASHFSAADTPKNISRTNKIQEDYLLMHSYYGLPVTEEHAFDTELLSYVTSRLHSVKPLTLLGCLLSI